MFRICFLCLLGSTVASTSDDVEAVTANMMSIMSAKKPMGPMPNPVCLISKCGGHLAKCAADKGCRSSLGCIAGCLVKDPSQQNQTCIFQCNSDFDDDVYDDFMYCVTNKNDCFGTKKGFDLWKACKAVDQVTPITQYRGVPLTKEVARNILMRGSQRGDWMVAKGESASYDCFDCQFLYWTHESAKNMTITANYKIHKSNGDIRWNTAVYLSGEWQGSPARYYNNASNYDGLAHQEDWRLLAADESDDPKWVFMYYCGAAPGVGEAYTGGYVLTPDGNMPTDAKSVSVINAVLQKTGMVLNCITDNSNCAGHPAPPAPSQTLVV